MYEGKLIHENSYPERNPNYEEIELDGIKVDFYDARRHVIHEIKKSDKIEAAGLWQLKYYLYVFEEHGIKDVKRMLEFPKQRKTETVTLNDDDRKEIRKMLADIEDVCQQDCCPVTAQQSGSANNEATMNFVIPTRLSNHETNFLLILLRQAGAERQHP